VYAWRKLAPELAQMNSVTFDAHVLFALLTIAAIGSTYLAGRIAERRGRRFIIWAWVAAFIGPLALPMLLLFPNLRGKNGNHASG
jgi:MFS family permease